MKAIVAFLLITSSIFILSAANAFATEPSAMCFGREYSTSHMKAHPKQTVKRFFMKFSKDERMGAGWVNLDIEAKIKKQDAQGSYSNYSTAMGCPGKMGAGTFTCSIDCDGGSAEVTWRVEQEDGYMVFRNQGFVLYGGCGDEDVEDSIWLDPKKGGDDTFHLYPLRTEFCQN